MSAAAIEIVAVEEWRPAPEPGYEASNLGRIRSWRSQFRRPHIMSANPTGKYGHLAINVQIGGRTVGRLVHRWVLESFVGPAPEGTECLHADSDPSNNRLDNLRWGTRVENAADCVRNGTDPHGERNGNSKLTWDAVRELRRRAADGESNVALSAAFGVTVGTVSKITRHCMWKERA